MSGLWTRVQSIRVPILLVVVFWMYAGYKFMRAGYIPEAWKTAKDYMRDVKI